eukprot:4140934-Pyramimonas_sp.AAC.1
MATTGVDMATTGVDMATTGVDMATTGVDMATTGVDMATTGVDMATTGVDMATAGVDMATTGVDMAVDRLIDPEYERSHGAYQAVLGPLPLPLQHLHEERRQPAANQPGRTIPPSKQAKHQSEQAHEEYPRITGEHLPTMPPLLQSWVESDADC